MNIRLIKTKQYSYDWEINGVDIKFSRCMSQYDTVEKVNSLMLNVLDTLEKGISFKHLLNEGKYNKNYMDFIKLINRICPKDLVCQYINLLLQKISAQKHKPLVRQDSIDRIVFEEIFGIKLNFESFKLRNKDDSDLKGMLDLIDTEYDSFIKNLIKECIEKGDLIKNISNSISTLSNKVKVFLAMDNEIIEKYMKVVTEKVMKSTKRKIKNNDMVISLVFTEIFGSSNIINELMFNKQINFDRKFFDDFVQNHYINILHNLIEVCVREKRPLSDVSNTIITDVQKFSLFFSCDNMDIEEYLYFYAQKYCQKREQISFWKFTCDIFGTEQIANMKTDKLERGLKVHYNYLKDFVDKQYEKQNEFFIKENPKQISLSNDKWKLFYKSGPKYYNKEFDFTGILCEEFKYEIKLFIMDELKHKRIEDINTLQLVIPCVNFLYQNNHLVKCFADINDEDVRMLYNHLEKEYITIRYKKLQPASIQKMIKRLGIIVEFLMKYSKRNKLVTIQPKVNIFTNIKFKNIQNMHKKTEIIPEEVIEQIEKYKTELQPRHQLMFDIFINSGIRLKEVIRLKENCLDDTEWENFKILKYTPYKVKNVAKKKSRSEPNEIIIPKDLAEKIEYQKNVTKELRKKYSESYIFIHQNSDKGKVRANISDGRGFVKAINRIIKKHNIVNCDNDLWYLTSRQFRKTVVVTMIENGATNAEIAYILGHYNLHTLQRYYEDVREKRLADMNSVFYRNKFQIIIGENNLRKFSEEERRILYIDFISEYRNVELGYCTKHLSEGECGKRSGKTTCATCEKLCTGKRFINEWIKLRDSQQNTINDLEKYYYQKNISSNEYEKFKEYKKEVYFLRLYQDIIDRIKD